jgi:hypothetical protein
VRHPRAKLAPLHPGYLFAGPSDIASDLLNKPGDIAPQQTLQDGKKPALRGASATAALIVTAAPAAAATTATTAATGPCSA